MLRLPVPDENELTTIIADRLRVLYHLRTQFPAAKRWRWRRIAARTITIFARALDSGTGEPADSELVEQALTELAIVLELRRLHLRFGRPFGNYVEVHTGGVGQA